MQVSDTSQLIGRVMCSPHGTTLATPFQVPLTIRLFTYLFIHLNLFKFTNLFILTVLHRDMYIKELTILGKLNIKYYIVS